MLASVSVGFITVLFSPRRTDVFFLLYSALCFGYVGFEFCCRPPSGASVLWFVAGTRVQRWLVVTRVKAPVLKQRMFVHSFESESVRRVRRTMREDQTGREGRL